ncbi:MAG TPA: hypothetical protein PKA19_07060 [Bacillota bacterium]|nr:hypothetical protein [Bacillota bacterium]
MEKKLLTILAAFALTVGIAAPAFSNLTLTASALSDLTLTASAGAAISNEAEGQSRGCFISMKAGDGEALMPDGTHALKNTPFIANDIAYVPLREVVELCGGIVRYNGTDKSVLIALPSSSGQSPDAEFSQVWIGSSRVLNNASEENPLRPYLYEGGEAGDYIPIIKDGSVFVPATYFDRFGFGGAFYDAQSSVILINNFEDGDYLAGFKVDIDFSSLDKSIRDRFKPIGREEIDGGALIEETLSDGDVELVIRTAELGYIKHEDVKEEIHMITLVSDKYCTPRGLRTGDGAEKVLRLYGLNGSRFTDGYFSNGRIRIEMEDGKVARFGIFSMD